MELSKSAAELQKHLIDKGYVTIEFCDIEEDGFVEILHYSLSKNDEIAKPDSCILHESLDLNSAKALKVLDSWLSQIKIYPDPRSL